MTTHLEVGDLTKKQNDIMYDLMNPEAEELEGIFDNDEYDDTYDHMLVGFSDGTYQLEVLDDMITTWFRGNLEDETGIREAIDKLYKSGLSLDKIKKAIKEWQSLFYKEVGDAPVARYKKFISDKRREVGSFSKGTVILNKIEKCMNYHLEWGFTMDIFKKFEAENKAVTKIQSHQRGNNVRDMLEKKGILYRDATSHWKNKNKESIRAELVEVMIDEDMTDARKSELMEEIEQFMTVKFMAAKKKRSKKKKKATKKKKSKNKSKKSRI